MGSSIRSAAPLALALAAGGCVTGHLLDAARRWEQPVSFEAASLDGDRLVLRYRTLISDDDGTPLGTGMRRVAVPVEAVRKGDLSVVASESEELPDRGSLAGRPLELTCGLEQSSLPCIEISTAPDGRPARLVLRDGGTTYAPFYANAFARSETARWAYPLLPAAAAVDAVGVPVLIFFAPAVIAVGD
jgi:hypothetical protein